MYDFSHYTDHEVTANAIRVLAMDGVQKANSGHPGAPMGLADVAVVLWRQFLRHNPADPHWPDRDRFVLSAGHASMLLYSLLHLSGYAVTLDDLRNFRQWGSITPGHPEYHHTSGVETTTGPLGQGFGNAVGMAIAGRRLAAQFNRPGFALFGHRVFVIASDGDLMEGVSHEAAALAGHLGLGNLIVLYDDNHITIDGPTSLAWSEDTPARFEAYGWRTSRVDGHDPQAIADAIATAIGAMEDEDARPALIACRTHIGFGSPNRHDTSKAHGEPLGEDEVRLARAALKWPAEEHFYVPQRAYDYLRPEGPAELCRRWWEMLATYERNYPLEGAQLRSILDGTLPAGWGDALPDFPAPGSMATRAASGKVLDVIVPRLPAIMGGSADLAPSNNTRAAGQKHVERGDFSGSYIHFGVREHAMGSLMNGMALSGLRPYGGTFLIFSDYMRPPVRLAAMMGLPVVYVYTHDSIGLGEDGPTHQPVEQLAGLRAIPNLYVFRPAEANETVIGWRLALERKEGPTALVLTRQGLATLPAGEVRGAARGGYVLRDASGRPEVILIASGSEVGLALAGWEELQRRGVAARVVSLPCWELFEEQPEAYRLEVLPPEITARVAIEAAARLGWERYAGAGGAIIGLDRFGASAPAKTIFEKLGFTQEAVVSAALAQIEQAGG